MQLVGRLENQAGPIARTLALAEEPGKTANTEHGPVLRASDCETWRGLVSPALCVTVARQRWCDNRRAWAIQSALADRSTHRPQSNADSDIAPSAFAGGMEEARKRAKIGTTVVVHRVPITKAVTMSTPTRRLPSCRQKWRPCG